MGFKCGVFSTIEELQNLQLLCVIILNKINEKSVTLFDL